jgi:hypothetical protein
MFTFLGIPPEGKGQARLMCQAQIAGKWRECEIESADASTQWATVCIHGSLFSVQVKFAQIQNVALKYPNGEILQNFGAPRVNKPESIAYIQYSQVQS